MKALLAAVLKKGLLVAGTLVVTAALLELGLRTIGPALDGPFIWPPHLRRTYVPDEDAVPGIRGTSRFEVNADGLRGDERTGEHDFLIITLGGSSTECLYLDQEESWPMLLQRRLNRSQTAHRVWVGNAGTSGIATREHLLQLPQLLQALPEVQLVVLLAGANDLCRRLAQDRSYDPFFMQRPEAAARVQREAFGVQPGCGLDDSSLPFYQRTHLWVRAREAKAWLAATLGLVSSTEQVVGAQYPSLRTRRREASVMRHELPDLGPALAEYAGNLGQLADIARQHGAQLVCLTQPTLWTEDLPPELEDLLWFGWVGKRVPRGPGAEYYATDALAQGIRAYNDVLRRVCRERGLLCVDLAARLAKDTSVLYDDVHFNERGASLAAAGVADAIGPLLQEDTD